MIFRTKPFLKLTSLAFDMFIVAQSAVDGVDIRHSSHELAVRTIKNASDKMMLLVQSLNTGVIRFPFTFCFFSFHFDGESLFPKKPLIKTLSFRHLECRSEPYRFNEETATTRDSIANTIARNHSSKAKYINKFSMLKAAFLDRVNLDDTLAEQ